MPKTNAVKKKVVSKSKRGKLARAAGARFELKVRADLENTGWIVSKWMNTIDLQEKKLVKVKNKFFGPGKPMMLGAGFPDFIAFRRKNQAYEVIGVEVKIRGYLDKEEKEKGSWYLKNKVFSKILIAKPVKEKRIIKIEYLDFSKKYEK